jgi:hypothetical protein
MDKSMVFNRKNLAKLKNNLIRVGAIDPDSNMFAHSNKNCFRVHTKQLNLKMVWWAIRLTYNVQYEFYTQFIMGNVYEIVLNQNNFNKNSEDF